MFGFFRTVLLSAADVEPALKLIRERSTRATTSSLSSRVIRGVFAGETPWSSKFEVRVDDDDLTPTPAGRCVASGTG